MITIKEVAELAGVAKSTVSRYLNNGNVSPETRKKIAKIIDETGYKPNTFARSLKAQHTNMIGVIIPRLNSPSTNNVLAGIDQATKENGYQLIITNANQSDARELENIDMLIKQKVDGILLLAQTISTQLKEKIKSSPVPILVLGQNISNSHSIIHNDYEAGRQIAKHALFLGHKDFIFLGVSSEDKAVGILRQKGFTDEINKAKRQLEVIQTSFSRKDAFKKSLEFLPKMQASYVACATDNIAIAVLKAANQLKFSVPKDFSLSGFGGYDSTNYVNPEITTVIYPYHQLGVQAVATLEQLIQDKEVPYNIVMDNVLSIKDSTTYFL